MKIRLKFLTQAVFLLAIIVALSRGIETVHAATAKDLLALFQGSIIPSPELIQRQTPAAGEKLLLSMALSMEAAGSIAYSSDRHGVDYDVFMQNADGGSPIWLAQDGNDVTPHWSPDGQQLLFASDRDGDFEIYLHLADGNLRQLTNNSTADIHPSWAPDGQHILFASDHSGSYYQIYSVNVDGSNLQQITSITGNNALWPVYSPNGDRIAFMRSSILAVTCGWNWDVWLMNADGSNQQRLTTQIGADVYPAWSHDGQYVLYAECGLFDLDFDLHRANVATEQTEYVMGNFLTNEWGGVYSPDNHYIAHSQNVIGAADIYIYDLIQGMGHNLSDDPADDLAPDWRDEPLADVCDSADFMRQPVMLVTGWSGSYEENSDELVEDEQLHYFRNWLGEYGYVDGCNLFYAAGTSPYEFLEENGQIIHEQLCEAANIMAQQKPEWNGHFDIIAHSYGGLRARAFIEEETYDDACQMEHWGERVYIDHLTTMGTPHGGEWPTLPFSPFILYSALTNDTGVQWPALVEMLPPVREWQNSMQNQPEAMVCYHTLGGDARSQVETVGLSSLLFLAQIWPGILDSPNDLAVHQTSAFALLNYPGNYSRVSDVGTPDLHGQVPWWLDPLGELRSFVNPNTTFEQAIKPYLLREQTGCPSPDVEGIQQPEGIMDMVTRQQKPQSLQPVAMIELSTGEISGNQTINGQFSVTTAEKSQISLYWSAGDINLTLTDPQGQPVNPDNVGGSDNIRYLELDTGYGLMAAYQITNTVTGVWSYQVQTGMLNQPATYHLMRLPETQIAVTSILPEWQPYNTSVVVAARITAEVTIPVVGGTVTAEISRPNGQTDMLTLLDDGQHQDGMVNDGIFANTYTATNDGGFYGVVYQATGFHGSYAYERTHTAVFSIAPATAALNNNYSENPIDGNGDGLYEALHIQVGLMVNTSGVYSLSGDLYKGDNFVAHAGISRMPLTTGSRVAPLSFDGRDIQQSGLNGPYTLRNILLLDETETTLLLQAADNVYTTAAYQFDQFGTPIVYLPLINRP